MAFNYDLTTDRGKVRLRLADTAGEQSGASSTSNDYVFEDDEIDYFLSSGGSVSGAVIEGLKVLLVDRARRAKSFKLKGLEMDDKSSAAAIKTALEAIAEDDNELPSVTVTFPALLPMDTDYDESNP